MTWSGESGEDQLARTAFTVDLERRGGPLPLRALRQVAYFLCELTGNLLPQPSLTDLVVRSVKDGEVVMSLPAGDVEASSQLLQHVRTQLGEQSIREFLDSWEPPSDDPPRT